MITRRRFLAVGGTTVAGLLIGCTRQDAGGKKPLAITESNIEGPFWRKDAPFRNKLAEGLKGDPLAISGRVLGPDGTPLRNAVVDVWHADKEGRYDNTSDKFLLRGRLRTDGKGLYQYETIMPGQYDLDSYGPGSDKRPAHVHYKVSADGYRPLTTQLYFKGDPFLKKDPFARESLVIELAEKNTKGTFDIVLATKG